MPTASGQSDLEPRAGDGATGDGATGDTALERRRAASGTVPAPIPEAQLQQAHVGELVGGIARDSRRIVSGYLELARHDLRSEIEHARIALISASTGMVLLGTGVLVGALALGQLLALVMPLAAGYAIVGGACLLVGGAVLLVARHAARGAAAPPPALEEAKEDVRWIKESV